MQYNIGCATWGWPIVWERKANGHVWEGSELGIEELDPALVTNWNNYQFALWLCANVQVGDWLYDPRDSRWRQVHLTNQWSAYYLYFLGRDAINYLDVIAYAPATKAYMKQPDGYLWREDLWWRLHGF